MAKGKVKKIATVVGVVLLILILTAAVIFKLYGNQLIRKGIIAGAQKTLQVGVRLDSVSLKVLAGKADLKNLEIDNPEGYKNPTFLKLGHAFVDLNVSSLLSDTVEIETVQIEDINLVIEQNGLSNNLKDILNNLPESQPAEPETKPAKKGAGKNIQIKVLEIKNVQVEAKLLPIPGRADQVKLPPINIRLENIGTAEKIDMAGLTKKILTEISKAVADKGKGLLPTDMVDSLGDELKELSGQLLEDTKDIGKGATDVIKGIGDIFKKKEE